MKGDGLTCLKEFLLFFSLIVLLGKFYFVYSISFFSKYERNTIKLTKSFIEVKNLQDKSKIEDTNMFSNIFYHVLELFKVNMYLVFIKFTGYYHVRSVGTLR